MQWKHRGKARPATQRRMRGVCVGLCRALARRLAPSSPPSSPRRGCRRPACARVFSSQLQHGLSMGIAAVGASPSSPARAAAGRVWSARPALGAALPWGPITCQLYKLQQGVFSMRYFSAAITAFTAHQVRSQVSASSPGAPRSPYEWWSCAKATCAHPHTQRLKVGTCCGGRCELALLYALRPCTPAHTKVPVLVC